ncbi:MULTISPECIES: response regulator transcription factor [Micromonospora]|uniref:Two component transcriptional regulator, LuxR family n=1 Tax=Micromonospora chokoriensis TaxID=356851 RepID=A0A1C4Y668_9ACTN|nr:response regulator transcription factor [Micromonospora chokoriensis]SCF16213.1 two component transcriptional regulator, LuxR family [Micromonospora chokoriensis]
MIHVVVAEEMGLLRGALSAALSGEEDMEVVADVEGVGDVVKVVRRYRPQVVVLALTPDLPDPVEVVTRIGVEAPEVAVLAMSPRWSPALVEAALAAGARGLVGKDGSLPELVRAIRTVAAGERALDPSAAAAVLWPAESPLTPREMDVLRMAAEGLPLKEIAVRLHLAHGTVRNHLSAILAKTGARNRLEAVWRARCDGWL